MKNFFYVYILVSQEDETIHYTGVACDLEERLLKHNQGACAHTSKHRTWRIKTVIATRANNAAEIGFPDCFIDSHCFVRSVAV